MTPRLRVFLVAVVLMVACGGRHQSTTDAGDLHVSNAADLGLDDANASYGAHDGDDPCRGSSVVHGVCDAFVGLCPSLGLACPCADGDTRVCQADGYWELILDGTHCPELGASYSYGGLGCLGAATTCTEPDGHSTCTCDDTAHIYTCGVGLE